MAFTLQSVTAIGVECSQALTSSFIQYLKLVGTAASADVAFDLGNPTGTFWTSVNNVAMKNAFFDCLTRSANIISCNVPAIENVKSRVGSAATVATGQYQKVVAAGSTLSLTLFAGEGVTTYTIMIVSEGKPNTLPLQAYVTP